MRDPGTGSCGSSDKRYLTYARRSGKASQGGDFFFFFFLPDRVLKTARKKFQEEGTAGMKASRCQSTGVCDELIIAL